MARKSGGSFFGNLIKHGIKFVLSAAVLSALVLGIAYGVRGASSASASELLGFLDPYLSKFGLRSEEVGQVAGDLIKRATDFGIGDSTQSSNEPGEISDTSAATNSIASLAIMADSHIGNDKNEYVENKSYLARALGKVKGAGADQMVHVGDITNFGAIADLQDAQEILNDGGVVYYTLPGDRDIAATSSTANYVSVFGVENHVFSLAGYKFILLNNSANYTPISQASMDWFEREVSDADFVILSQPLYTQGVIVNCQYMGSSCDGVEDAELKVKQEQVLAQRNELLGLIRGSDVKAVIAGDHHMSSETQDETKPSLTHYVVGAVGNTFKEGYSQAAWQSQRFSLLRLYENGAFTVEDVLL